MKAFERFIQPLCMCKAEKITDHCGRFVKGRTLDFGAGRCYIAKKLKENYAVDIECLDIDDLNETNLKLVVYNGKKIPYKDSTFGTVLIVYVLHHCPEPLEALKECRRVCKKNGRIIIFEDFGFVFYTHLLDWIVNKMHSVEAPLNFKKREEWLEVFKNLGFTLEHSENGVEKQVFYPFVRHTMFVLKVNK